MIYLIDTIGNETGMNLYDRSFTDKFREAGQEVSIISNFERISGIPRLSNYYHGAKIIRVINLLADFVKLTVFSISHKKDVFIYQSFGLRILDMFLFLPFLHRPKSYLLVHDLYEFRTGAAGDRLVDTKDRYYSYIRNFICHSEDVREKLLSLRGNTSVRILYVPHIEYTYETVYDDASILPEVKSLFEQSACNILFFGQISSSKGILELLDSWESVPAEFNLVVAGRDKGGLLDGYEPRANVKLLRRYIENDELNYLFSHSDAVVLPYREIYQSGVLETVIHFKKPALLSPIVPFLKYLETYPSFGMSLGAGPLYEVLKSLKEREFYAAMDLEKYKSSHSLELLVRDLI